MDDIRYIRIVGEGFDIISKVEYDDHQQAWRLTKPMGIIVTEQGVGFMKYPMFGSMLMVSGGDSILIKDEHILWIETPTTELENAYRVNVLHGISVPTQGLVLPN